MNKLLQEKKYIVTYFLGESDNYYSNIIKFARENSYDIINIPVFNNMKLNKYNLEEKIGPSEFLSIIKNSSFVFTDSFHGTIFSIKYNVSFYTYKRFNSRSKVNQNSRIINLLDKLGLSNRIVEDNVELINETVNYSEELNNIINKLIKDSKDYLYSSLIKVKESKKKC